MKSWFRKNIYYVLSLVVVLLVIGVIYFVYFKKLYNKDSIFNEVNFIGHAFYGIDGIDYTNSLESLEFGYNKGIRVMEVDFLFTSDAKLVLNHYWEYNYRESYNYFMNKKIKGKYTPMDFGDLLEYMEKYPDLYIVIDTKEDEYNFGNNILDIYRQIVEETKKYNEKLLDRFVAQIHDMNLYKDIIKIHNFNNKLVTIYKMWPYDVKRVVYFCLKNKIDLFVLPIWYIEDNTVSKEDIEFIKSKGIKVFVHTINDIDTYNKLKSIGIDGVYTDFLS